LVVLQKFCKNFSCFIEWIDVYKGAQRRSAFNPDSKRKVAAIVINENFDIYDPAQKNDIALIFLESQDASIVHESNIIINDMKVYEDLPKKAKVIGFGNASSLGLLLTDGMREAEVPIITTDRCINTQGYDDIDETQICAGNLTRGGVDSCHGDSGGPLFIKGKRNRYHLIGIVSWGVGCAQKQNPGIYTAIKSQIPWIAATIKNFREENGDKGGNIDGTSPYETPTDQKTGSPWVSENPGFHTDATPIMFPSKEHLHLKQKTISKNKASITLSNDLSIDVFTWKITCPFSYTLTDKNENQFQPEPDSDGYSVLFDHKLNRYNGIIPSGRSRTFAAEFPESDKQTGNFFECTVNKARLFPFDI
ncbi:MAG: serine protease, partial [Oligoflexales bacterium]|nr:serine protease [Oligoflexales bacterium]